MVLFAARGTDDQPVEGKERYDLHKQDDKVNDHANHDSNELEPENSLRLTYIALVSA